MNQDTAISRLSSMVAADDDPVLDSEKLVELLDMFAVADFLGNSSENKATVPLYANATTYIAGDVVRDNAFRFWRAIIPGTSTGLTFPAVTGIVQRIPYFVRDGEITWQDAGGLWIPTWDLNKAAAEGWRWKAAKLSKKFDFASDNQEFSVRQRHANALLMVEQYRRKSGGTFQVDARQDFANISAYLLPGG